MKGQPHKRYELRAILLQHGRLDGPRAERTLKGKILLRNVTLPMTRSEALRLAYLICVAADDEEDGPEELGETTEPSSDSVD